MHMHTDGVAYHVIGQFENPEVLALCLVGCERNHDRVKGAEAVGGPKDHQGHVVQCDLQQIHCFVTQA
jgi:hypothetical protein